jgi:hypothetical protein
MEWVDALLALQKDPTKRTLRALAMKSVPPGLVLAEDILPHIAPLPSAEFVHEQGEQRLLASDVAVAVGQAVFTGNADTVDPITIHGIAVICQGDPEGLVGFSALRHPITVDFTSRNLRVKLAILAQNSNIGA